jgi:hypothetical protein
MTWTATRKSNKFPAEARIGEYDILCFNVGRSHFPRSGQPTDPDRHDVGSWPQAADPARPLHVRSYGVKRTQCAHSEFFR